MPHGSRSQHSDYSAKEDYEKRSRSQSRSRMIIERTKVKLKPNPETLWNFTASTECRNPDFRISMAKETRVDDTSFVPVYRSPITVQCPSAHGSTLAHAEYVENIEEWESMGRRTRSNTNEGFGGQSVEHEERRSRVCIKAELQTHDQMLKAEILEHFQQRNINNGKACDTRSIPELKILKKLQSFLNILPL
uniref:Uncharacterized protein n=1 Tax=Syphacia muris TaxID=451379 RepID=A0A158R5D0_9BILA